LVRDLSVKSVEWVITSHGETLYNYKEARLEGT
jgi:hypothetical protein